ETLALRARVEKRLVGREPLAPDDALGEVAALERRDLRGEEARGAVHAPVALVEVQHVLLQLELDRRLARQLEARRGGVEARRHQGDEQRQAERQCEARRRQPAVLVEEPEVVAQVARRYLAELRVDRSEE